MLYISGACKYHIKWYQQQVIYARNAWELKYESNHWYFLKYFNKNHHKMVKFRDNNLKINKTEDGVNFLLKIFNGRFQSWC
jgi:hypothetical protein